MARKSKVDSMCKSCEFYVFTPTFSHPEGCYHCESGFSPCDSCFEMCKSNRKARSSYFFEYGVQLKLF